MSKQLNCDVLVVGGGAAATLAALVAAQQGFNTILLRTTKAHQTLPTEDGRVFALTTTTWETLTRWNVLSTTGKMRAVSMSSMNLFFQHFEKPVQISAWQQELTNLAYLYANKDLLQDCEAALANAPESLTQLITQPNNTYVQTETGWQVSGCLSDVAQNFVITTRCLVVAEGAQSKVREQIGFEPISHTEQIDYGQSAIVCAFKTQARHRGVATQWFLTDGSIVALLPTKISTNTDSIQLQIKSRMRRQRASDEDSTQSTARSEQGGQQNATNDLELEDALSLVWSAPHDPAFLQSINQDDILGHLQSHIGSQLHEVYGELTTLTAPHSFALKRIRHEHVIHHHAVLLGDAAATLHPLAGMGFNLVMSDLLLFEQSLKEIKQGYTIQSALHNYQTRMKKQRLPIEWMVDGVFALNRPRHAFLSTAWGLAGALKSSPWVQNKWFESWVEPKIQRLLVQSFQKFTQPFVLERLKK